MLDLGLLAETRKRGIDELNATVLDREQEA